MNDDQIIETGTKPNKAKQELNRNIHVTDIAPLPEGAFHAVTVPSGREGGAPRRLVPRSHGGSGDSWDYGGSGDFGEPR